MQRQVDDHLAVIYESSFRVQRVQQPFFPGAYVP